MTDIENYYYHGSFKADAIGKWTGNYCTLYLLPAMVCIVSDESNYQGFRSYILAECNTQEKLKAVIGYLDNEDDYSVIVQLINFMENKENEAAEVAAIVNGSTPVEANELHFPMRIRVRGSKPAAFVLGIFTLALFISGIKGGMAWAQNSNPVDALLFALLTFIPLILALFFAIITYRLFRKVTAVNNSENFGIWLTHKYLICHDSNEGLKYVPLLFIDSLGIYKSIRPPLSMVTVAVKKPYKPLRLVANWLKLLQSAEQLKTTIEQQITILNLPAKLIKEADAAIKYADSYTDEKKMYLLIVRLQDVMNENRQSKREWDMLALYIDRKIANWPDAIKIIPEDWVFNIEINENWEYGVNGVTSSEKLNGVNEHAHWLLPIGRLLVIQNQGLENYFYGMEMNQLATLLSTSAIQKMILKISMHKYAPEKIKQSLSIYDNLKKVSLIFEQEFIENREK